MEHNASHVTRPHHSPPIAGSRCHHPGRVRSRVRSRHRRGQRRYASYYSRCSVSKKFMITLAQVNSFGWFKISMFVNLPLSFLLLLSSQILLLPSISSPLPPPHTRYRPCPPPSRSQASTSFGTSPPNRQQSHPQQLKTKIQLVTILSASSRSCPCFFSLTRVQMRAAAASLVSIA
jgi:hypothetical protein